MKKGTTYITAVALAMALLFNACSVEKRHYRRGFHIEANKKAPKPEVAKETAAPVNEVAVIETEITTNNVTTPISTVTMPDVVSAPVEKTGIAKGDKVKTDNKVVADNKTYTRGKKELMVTHMLKNAMKGAGPTGMLGDDKLISILFCIFLGWLGIHRFYLGYPISAIIMIALFLGSLLGGFLVISFLAYLCGLLLFAWIVVDLVFLILDRPLFFPQ